MAYHVIYIMNHEDACKGEFETEGEMLEWVNEFQEDNYKDTGNTIYWIINGDETVIEPTEVKTKYVIKRK